MCVSWQRELCVSTATCKTLGENVPINSPGVTIVKSILFRACLLGSLTLVADQNFNILQACMGVCCFRTLSVLSSIRGAFPVSTLTFSRQAFAPHCHICRTAQDARGVMSAREFVWWYNAHPDAAHLKVDLSKVGMISVLLSGMFVPTCTAASQAARQCSSTTASTARQTAVNIVLQIAVGYPHWP